MEGIVILDAVLIFLGNVARDASELLETFVFAAYQRLLYFKDPIKNKHSQTWLWIMNDFL